MSLFDVLSLTVIVIIAGIVRKLWNSLVIFLEKKAENFATKQDITEITLKTEQIQADFHKLLVRFDADLKFKYDFYAKQYRELYSSLFCMVCESEALRYILTSLSGDVLPFEEIPIVEYEIDSNREKNPQIETTICEKMSKLISDKYVYASPALIKLIITLARVEKYQTTVKNKEQKKVLELQLKAEIIRTILKDYYWLRQQLQLKESENESEKIETGEFISIR